MEIDYSVSCFILLSDFISLLCVVMVLVEFSIAQTILIGQI